MTEVEFLKKSLALCKAEQNCYIRDIAELDAV